MTQCSVTLQKMEERYWTPFRYAHEFMGFTRWQDCEEKIYIKRNAARIRQRELTPVRLKGQQMAWAPPPNLYQAVEGRYRVTRNLLEGMGLGDPLFRLNVTPHVVLLGIVAAHAVASG